MPPRVRLLAVLIVACSWIGTPVSAAVCGLTCGSHGAMTMAAHGGMTATETAPPVQAAQDHHQHDVAAPAGVHPAATSMTAAAALCAGWGADPACCSAAAASGVPAQGSLRSAGPDPRPAVMASSLEAAAAPPGGRPPAAVRAGHLDRRLPRRASVLRI
ncbi:MAG: hypothetical protein R2745_12850 [Vicinamibacterales bacterium]